MKISRFQFAQTYLFIHTHLGEQGLSQRHSKNAPRSGKTVTCSDVPAKLFLQAPPSVLGER